jgi:polysaccharide chain length determinant protein (PEP-CTERM system associated)
MKMMSLFEKSYPLLRGIWIYRWPAVGAAWLICIMGWIGVALLPNLYESSAKVYVNADPVLTPLLKGLAADTDPTRQVDYMRRTLLSRPNLEEAARLANLDLGGPQQRDALLDHLATTLRIDPITPNLLSISYRATTPAEAANVVQSLLTIFADKTTGSSRTEMDSAERFLTGEIAAYETKLREKDAQRAALTARYPDLLPIDRNGSRLDQVRGQVVQLQFQLSDVTEQRDALQKELDGVPAMLSVDQMPQVVIGTSGQPDTPARRLQDARKRLDTLRAQYTDEYPDILATRREIAQLEAEAKNPSAWDQADATKAKGQIANPVYDQLKLKLVDADTTIASIRHKLADSRGEQSRLEATIKSAPGILARARDLDRDYEVIKKAYDELVQRLQAAQIADAANTKTDQIQFRIVDPPDVPVLPAAPNRLLFNTAVLLIGLGAGVALPLLILQFDSSVSTIGQLRNLGVPILGSVSRLVDQGTRRAVVRQLAGVCAGTLLLLAMYGALLAVGATLQLDHRILS